MPNDFGEFLDNEGSAIKVDSNLMKKVFTWMAVGLIITAITSLITVSSESMLEAIFENFGVMMGLLIAEFALVIVLSRTVNKLSYVTAVVGFIAYSIINGLTLSVIFLVYEIGSITSIFFMTAGIFALMALVGYTTNIDLSKIGNILLIGLIGIIIGSILNMFILSNTLDIWLCVLGGIIFLGLTAYDIQKIKQISMSASEEQVNTLSIVCALTLYLDFINLFLKLLRLFGKRKN